jgi:hypothetical protein
MRTRENSVVISLRVEKDLQREFNALSAELGALTSRKLRESFVEKMQKMRAEANEKRESNGRPSWESEWNNGIKQ